MVCSTPLIHSLGLFSLFLSLGQKALTEVEEAKAVVGTVDGSRLESIEVGELKFRV